MNQMSMSYLKAHRLLTAVGHDIFHGPSQISASLNSSIYNTVSDMQNSTSEKVDVLLAPISENIRQTLNTIEIKQLPTTSIRGLRYLSWQSAGLMIGKLQPQSLAHIGWSRMVVLNLLPQDVP